MKIKIGDNYYSLHDWNRERNYKDIQNHNDSYCVCCVQYIKAVMKNKEFQEKNMRN